MARRRNHQEFQTIRSEGGLLPPDLLRRLIDPRSKLPGTRPEDYALAARERLNEVVTQSWNRLRRHWTEFRAAAANLSAGEAGTGLTNDKWSLPLLRELGFGLLPATAGPALGGRTYAVRRFFGPAPVHLLGCGLSLDRRAAGQRGAASANPHGLVQEFLNRSDAHLWAVVSNGLRLRILRDSQALSRQSWLEFDLEAMFSGEVYPDFVLLWLVAHATRFAPRDGDRPETCWLERWTREADRQGARALGELRGSVERALEILGAGFTGHPKNAALREALRTGQIGLDDFHGQLLRVVYRLIFLFVAEDRRLDGQPLLHPRDDSDAARTARERYAAHYGAARLRDLAGRIKGSRHGDLWRQFQLLVGALSGDPGFETARRALALPALGSFLWDPASTDALDDAELTNHDFLETLRRLAFIRQGRVLRPVDYRNLGAEELGGVYEGLLGLTPRLGGDGARFTFAEFAGNARKTSGSYYTPDALVQCLLDTALDPVVEAAVRGKAGAEAERAILDLKVCDPAAGSGHFLVGAAHRLARHLARVRAHSAGDGEPSPLLHQQALRDVIGRCLYGVDRNPMAAELCRVSLWLEALEPGKPLSFLDHHIRVGNSLLGATPELIEAGLPDEAFNPIQGDDRKLCSGLRRKNRVEREDMQHVMDLMVAEPPGPEYGSIASLSRDIDESPDDTLDEVRRKAARFQRLIVSPRYRRKQRVADAWCAAFVQPKRAGGDPALCITTRTVRRLQADPGSGIDPGAGTGTDVDTGAGIGPDANPDPGADTDSDTGARTGTYADSDAGTRTSLDPGFDTGAAPGFDLDAGTGVGTSPGADALSPAQRREVERLARRYRFFHWDLAFPEVFESGGFDCVLGNPPWERVKLQEKEWFAERKPEIADAPTAAARKRMIETLKTSDFPLYRRFLDDLRESEGWSHLMRNTGRYPLCGRGDINLYAVFAECMRNVVNERGRTGCVLPTGIATDDTTKFFFQDVVETRALASVFDFENRSGLFPDVDSRMKFCLFTAGSGRRTAIGQRLTTGRQTVTGQRPDIDRQPAASGQPPATGGAEFVFFAHAVEELRNPERRFTLSPEDIALLNPNTRTCPIFRSRKDAELTKAIYRRVPVLIREPRDGRPAENPWGIQFNRMFDMSNDSQLFHTREQLEAEGWELAGNVFLRDGAEYLPLYEAKMVHHYNHRWATLQDGEAGEPSPAEAEEPGPDDTVQPRYWVEAREVYLRTADLPKELLDGLRDRNTPAIVQSVAHLLFAHWLYQEFDEPAEKAAGELSSAWKRFTELHPFARDLAVMQSNPRGNGPASISSFGPSNLPPAKPLHGIGKNGKHRSARYPAGQISSVSAYPGLADRYSYLTDSVPRLRDESEALDFAEDCLRRSAPRWLTGWRDITNSTNERTVVGGVFPLSAVGNNLPVWTASAKPARMLPALLSSFACDFAARLKVGGTHLNFFIARQIPALPPTAFDQPPPWSKADAAIQDWLLPRILELTFTSWDLEPFANDCGYRGPPFRWDEERRFLLRCELDAAFFHLYLPADERGGWRPARCSEGCPHDEGSSEFAELERLFPTPRDAVAYVMDTFPIVRRKDEEKFGEYRTKRVVLDIYDAIQVSIAAGGGYRTALDPPPADPRCCHPPRENT